MQMDHILVFLAFGSMCLSLLLEDFGDGYRATILLNQPSSTVHQQLLLRL